MKAISTVIASILMLMIVIALAGTTFLFISGTFTSKTATAFELIDAVNDTVTIRNLGTEPITRITANLDGNIENIAIVPNIQGLVSYWSFNEGSSTTTDDNSDNNNIGTLKDGATTCSNPPTSGCPTWVNGRFGNALQFDGSNDYVNVPHSASLAPVNEITVMTWIKTATAGTMWVISKNDGGAMPNYDIEASATYAGFRARRVSDGTTYAVSASGLDISSWTHVTGTLKDGVLRIYINGELRNTNSVGLPFNIQNNGDALWFGDAGAVIFANFNGIIDEVAIFNRALTEGEIKSLNSGLVSSGQVATVKPLISLTKGTHTLRLCTSSMCNTAILTIQ